MRAVMECCENMFACCNCAGVGGAYELTVLLLQKVSQCTLAKDQYTLHPPGHCSLSLSYDHSTDSISKTNNVMLQKYHRFSAFQVSNLSSALSTDTKAAHVFTTYFPQ